MVTSVYVSNRTTNKKEETIKKDKQHYLVVYLNDGTIHARPGDSEEDCKDTEQQLMKSKWGKEIKLTKIIKRNLSQYKDGMIL